MISEEKKLEMAEVVIEQNARLLAKLDKAKALEKELLAALKSIKVDLKYPLENYTKDIEVWVRSALKRSEDAIAKAEAQSVGCGRIGHTDEGEKIVCGVNGELCDVCQQKAEAQEANDEQNL